MSKFLDSKNVSKEDTNYAYHMSSYAIVCESYGVAKSVLKAMEKHDFDTMMLVLKKKIMERDNVHYIPLRNAPTDSGTLNYILSIPGVEYLKLGTTCGSYKFTKENIDELIRKCDE